MLPWNKSNGTLPNKPNDNNSIARKTSQQSIANRLLSRGTPVASQPQSSSGGM